MISASQADFAERLGTAIRQRGLALSRIRDHLAAQGLAVSVATLSYWTSGRSRPTRGRSLEIVRALEILLGTEPGWLIEAVPTPAAAHDLGVVLNRPQELSDVAERYDLHTSADWKILTVCHHAFIDAAGRERACENWLTLQALAPTALGYTRVVEGHADTVHATGLGLAHVSRTIQVAPDLFVIEFLLDEAVPRGTKVLMGDRVEFLGERPACTGSGFALRSPVNELTLQVSFEDSVPDDVRVASQLPDGDDELHERAPLRSGGSVQTVLSDVPAGLHSLVWEW